MPIRQLISQLLKTLFAFLLRQYLSSLRYFFIFSNTYLPIALFFCIWYFFQRGCSLAMETELKNSGTQHISKVTENHRLIRLFDFYSDHFMFMYDNYKFCFINTDDNKISRHCILRNYIHDLKQEIVTCLPAQTDPGTFLAVGTSRRRYNSILVFLV